MTDKEHSKTKDFFAPDEWEIRKGDTVITKGKIKFGTSEYSVHQAEQYVKRFTEAINIHQRFYELDFTNP